jgi:hypothetical protein
MAACTLVAILRDAREERAPQDEDNTSLQGGFRACAKWRIPEWRRLKFIVMPALVAGIHVFFIAQGRRGWPGRSPAMTKIKASASCSALIQRSGRLAASRRMAACTLVAILRDAREERAPQDEEKSDLHVQPLGRIARRECGSVSLPSLRAKRSNP